ncbi:LysR family transcriptional regulator [Streptoalloteichus hindustanus]|uniref:DNA-binding transcriptional regulator, LysR family n=1 Tax=Streptoalloteichus hindustanus TaxID=2017 RepID=A0A1M5I6Z4_STRHI|nr:LysR family transcriptional regulator [Streptoalloteichus hindustanus]SHG24021.1 DNA-binding transcriptional regulator, LysR family [Streptoalloteichus hindustanus]
MREIEAFLAVAEELHFGRAAERLRLSTSRVSNLVRMVERRAGVPLFLRTSRVVTPTPQGMQLFGELRSAYVQIERALADVRRTADLGGGVLRVGFATTLPETLGPQLTASFERLYPEHRVVASAQPTTDLFRWSGRDWPVDVFVTWMPVGEVPADVPLRIGPVIDQVERAVMLGSSHPLAGRSVIDVEDLAEHEVIYPALPSWFGEYWTPATTPGGREIKRRRLSTAYVEDVLRVVAAGDLAHLTFASLLTVYRRPGVELVPLTGLPPMPVRAVWRSGPQEMWARMFAEASAVHCDDAD